MKGGQNGGTGGGGNTVYNYSADALQGAGGAYQDAGALYGNPGITGNAPTYNPSLMTPASAALPNTIASGMSQYTNPYTNQVINRTMADIGRTTEMQQNMNGANAGAVDAFGGSRQGIVEALTNSEAQKNMGDISANLRMTGFNTAAGLAGQDITNLMQGNQFNAGLAQQGGIANQASSNEAGRFNAGQESQWAGMQSADEIARAGGLLQTGAAGQGLGGLTFDIGNNITQQQGQAGSMQQQLLQSILSGAQGQYGAFMQQPQNLLNMQLAALGMNPMTGETTTTGSYTPGMLDYAGLAAQLGGGWMGMRQ